MLGRLLTKLYTFFVIFFGTSKVLQIEEMETDNVSQPELTQYHKRLLHLHDILEQLPERVTEAGDFDNINYRLIVSKFSTIKELINNLAKISYKFQEVVESPLTASTDIPGFLQISQPKCFAKWWKNICSPFYGNWGGFCIFVGK